MASSGTEAADALKTQGNAAYKQGRLGEALSFYERAAAAQPGHAVYKVCGVLLRTACLV